MQDIGRKVCRTLYRKTSEIRDCQPHQAGAEQRGGRGGLQVGPPPFAVSNSNTVEIHNLANPKLRKAGPHQMLARLAYPEGIHPLRFT